VLPTLENVFKIDGGINKCQGFMSGHVHDGYDVFDVNLISAVRDFMC